MWVWRRGLTKQKEVWKDIVGYEGLYLVSNYGQIKSLPRKTTSGKLLKQVNHTNGRLGVGLSKNGKEKTHCTSRLVIEAFVGPRPMGMECCHNDGNPQNNYISNLRYDTHKNNMKDMKKHGTFSPPPIHLDSDNPNSKMDRSSIVKIRKLLQKGVRVLDIAKLFGVHITTIYRIKNKETWGHLQNA